MKDQPSLGESAWIVSLKLCVLPVQVGLAWSRGSGGDIGLGAGHLRFGESSDSELLPDPLVCRTPRHIQSIPEFYPMQPITLPRKNSAGTTSIGVVPHNCSGTGSFRVTLAAGISGSGCDERFPIKRPSGLEHTLLINLGGIVLRDKLLHQNGGLRHTQQHYQRVRGARSRSDTNVFIDAPASSFVRPSAFLPLPVSNTALTSAGCILVP